MSKKETPDKAKSKKKEKEESKENSKKNKEKEKKKPGEPQPPSTTNVTDEGSKESALKRVSLKFGVSDEKPNEYYTKDQMEKFNMSEFIKNHFATGSKKMEYTLPELHIILDKVKEEFMKCETLLEVKAPVHVCGDIHGQYSDLMRIFNACGPPFKSRYLFLGDYVDRGRHSLEVIILLLACRVQFPKRVFLLRGNHELQNINRVYGFLNELKQRFRTDPNPNAHKLLYNHFNEVFASMPLAALVSKRILCMHGGLSPELNTMDDIRNIQRPLKVVKGLAQDLLWADPEKGAKDFEKNKVRAVSHIFGEKAVHDKCKQLDIDLVIRAHQVVEFGYAFFADRSLITVFSASRYHEELLNYAAVVVVDGHLDVSFVQLKPKEFEEVRHQAADEQKRTADVPEEEDKK